MGVRGAAEATKRKPEGDAGLIALNHEAFEKRQANEGGPLARTALEAATAAGDEYNRALALRTLACVEYDQGRTGGFELALEALTILERYDDPRALSTSHNVIACYHYIWAQYDLMLERLRLAYAFALEAGDGRMQARALMNMAVAAEKIGDYGEALKLDERALELWNEAGDEKWYWITTGFIGEALRRMDRAEEALPYLEEGYHRLMAIDPDGRNATEAAAQLASGYAAVGRFAEAEEKIAEAIGRCEDGKNALHVATVHLTAGEILFQQDHHEEAMRELLVAREMGIVHDNINASRHTLKLLAETARKLGRPEEALAYLLEYVDARETVFSSQADQRTRTLQVLHQVEMTQKEATLVRQQNEELQILNKRLVATLAEKDALHAELMRHAVTDELTGVSNRRHIMEFGRREFERHRRLDAPLAIVMLDVDHFKAVNDKFGHAAGDEILRLIAKTCADGVRAIDAFGRWGGEEFCIVLPGARMETARRIAERIREAVAALPVGDLLHGGSITVSLGVSEVGAHHRSLDELLSDADQALYNAKRTGRNRVALAPERVAVAA